MTIEFRDLAPERAEHLLGFFEGVAFPDNPLWASCYCFFYHFARPGEEWAKRTREANRRAKAELIRAGAAHGVLAYEDGRVVGWVHVAPRASLAGLATFFDESRRSEGATKATVVCFVVPPDRRHQGLATALLSAAEDSMRRLGMTAIEAFPLPEPAAASEQLSSDARNYHGTLSMFQRAGYAERGPAGPFIEVAKPL